MNTLLNLLGLEVLNGGTNYLAENMWDKQINSLVRDQQEIGRFSSDLNAAKKSALNTVLGLYPDLKSAEKDPTIPFLSSIGNKAGPTKYKSDFASSAISGASNSLRQANHYGLFKLKKKPTATAEITPETTTATINPFLPNRWLTTEQRQLFNKYSTKKNNTVEDNNYMPNYTSSFLGTEQKLNDYNNNYYHPTFNALNYMLNSHNSLYK